jgi:hypothetical protein
VFLISIEKLLIIRPNGEIGVSNDFVIKIDPINSNSNSRSCTAVMSRSTLICFVSSSLKYKEFKLAK